MSRALALAIVTCFAPVAGAVPLLTGFGGPTGYGIPTHCLHPSDNGSYAGAQPGTAATPVPVDIRQCIGGCQCHACSAGLRCLTDGRCVDEDCLDVTCPEGSRCERGECVDRCASPSGARLCLEDEVCRGGRCVSARDATPNDAGEASLDGGATSPMAMHPSGCGCGVGGARSWPIGSALVGLGWMLATRRRRRSVA